MSSSSSANSSSAFHEDKNRSRHSEMRIKYQCNTQQQPQPQHHDSNHDHGIVIMNSTKENFDLVEIKSGDNNTVTVEESSAQATINNNNNFFETVASPNTKIMQKQKRERSKSRIVPKLQPKATLFLSRAEECSGDGDGNRNILPLPQTPDYDYDDYDAFGFGLISASKEKKVEQGESSHYDRSSASDIDELTDDADTNIDNYCSPSIASSVQGGTSGERGGKYANRISSISLSRVLSAESYISDDSTSSSDRVRQNHHDYHDKNQQYTPTTIDDTHYNHHDLPRYGSSISSNNTNNNFSVLSSRKNSLQTQTSSRSLTLHLMSSDRDEDESFNEDYINSSVDSSSHQEGNEEDQPSSVDTRSRRHSYHSNDRTTQTTLQGSMMPPLIPTSQKLMAHTHPTPAPNDEIIELILSQSNESDEKQRLHRTIPLYKHDDERITHECSVDDAQRVKTFSSSSSIDDPWIANELRTYFRRISSSEADSPSPPSIFHSSSHSSGRQPPIRSGHVNSIVVHDRNETDHRFIDNDEYDKRQMTFININMATHRRDSPFMSNLRMINSQASYGSVIHSPLGERSEHLGEINEQQQQSQRDRSGKTISCVCTTPTDQPFLTSTLKSRDEDFTNEEDRRNETKLYSSRWTMLMHMFVLNVLSGWTCFSIAPFANLAIDVLRISPDRLVATFFVANCIASVFEPMILNRLGLRRTVLFGSLLLMLGNMLKGGTVDFKHAFLGFILAGLSGPLYQNTPAMVIMSWFPNQERRIAEDVVSVANQLGIVCSFFYGNSMVKTSDDMIPYFHMLSVISMSVFVVVAMQFNDCPPTSPSGNARVIRGTVERPIFAFIQFASPSISKGTEEFEEIERVEHDVPFSALVRKSLTSYGAADRNEEDGNISTVIHNQSISENHHRMKFVDQFGIGKDSGVNFRAEDYLPPTTHSGAEPIITQTSHLLIHACDDQLWLALNACTSRKDFFPCISAFAVSRIMMNLLSTFLCYVTPKTDIFGWTFQLVVLVSLIVCRKMTTCTRSYWHNVIVYLVVLGSISLALCGQNLGSDIRLHSNILVVALFVGPLQPLSTKLGAEVVSPLSEKTATDIQILFSNLLSAVCIPVFTSIKNTSLGNGLEFINSFRFLALFCSTIHFTAIYFSLSPNRKSLTRVEEGEGEGEGEEDETGEKDKNVRVQSEQRIESSSKKNDRNRSTSKPLARDQPWEKKYPFLLPRTV